MMTWKMKDYFTTSLVQKYLWSVFMNTKNPKFPYIQDFPAEFVISQLSLHSLLL